jgi:tetratricopeptide (TPR) repeat protein
MDEALQAKSMIDKIYDKELRHFSQGIYYYKTNDRIQALETFNIFIRDYPQSKFRAEAYLNKADLLYEMGRLNDAIYDYKLILDEFSESGQKSVINRAHYGLAWCYLKNGQFKQAVDEFKSTLEYANNPIVQVSSQIQIADAYQEAGKYLEALDIYSTLIKNHPNTVYADYIQFQIGITFLKNQELEKAFFALRNLKNNFPSSKLIPKAQYYLAVGYFSQANYVEAKGLLEDFIDSFSKDELIAKAVYLYGKCFFNEGDYSRALEIFQNVTKKLRDPEIEELVSIDIGNAYMNLSRFEEAQKAWGNFLKRYPDSPYAGSIVLYLGGLYEKEHKYAEAEKYYRKIIDEYKGASVAEEALLSLAHLYWNKGERGEAKRYFEKLAKKQTPLSLKGKLYLAKIAQQEGRLDQSLRLYNELIDSESSIANIARGEKALLLKETDDCDNAIPAFQDAIDNGLDTPEIRFSLGQCLEKAGRTGEAIEEYFKVAYMFTDQDSKAGLEDTGNFKVRSYFRIARIYERQNNMTAAKTTYQKIVDLKVKESAVAQSRLEELEEN